jgi:hypothetical protein
MTTSLGWTERQERQATCSKLTVYIDDQENGEHHTPHKHHQFESLTMYLSTLFLTVLATLTHSATIPKRQLELPNGQTVKQDILNIHNAVLALDTTIQAYQGVPLPTSLVEGTPVLLGVAEIHKVNRAGFRHALASMQFSVEDSREVIESVVDTGT